MEARVKRTALILCGVAALATFASAQSQNPFQVKSDTGETVHVLPTPAAVHSPRDTGPTFAPPSQRSEEHTSELHHT